MAQVVKGMGRRQGCKCAWMPCAHCKKDHNKPDGSCSKCNCKGWL